MSQARKIRIKNPGQQKIYDVYINSTLTMRIPLTINEVGRNIKQNLERMISKNIEGRCVAEGFIKPGTINVVSYSSGTINNNKVEFQTVFECKICYPVEGMWIECMTKTITKAGIHAEVVDKEGNIPITVFVARDHHYTDKQFSMLKENTKIIVRIVGVRFELNDPYICVIGKLMDQSNVQDRNMLSKPPIQFIGGDSEGSLISRNIDDDDDNDNDD
jgi:DNA-directed RNA polymerase subunit E'/Rpb7